MAAAEAEANEQDEDESDLVYYKELRILLEDHKHVAKFLMIVSIIVMLSQVVFAVWCMQELAAVGTWEDALLINWFHLLIILLNLYIVQTFVKRIKAKQPSSSLGYLSTYITLLIY